MAKPQFGRAVQKIGRTVLEPLGFRFHNDSEPGMGAYSFLKSWKGGFDQGIGLYPSLRSRAFYVELGVTRDNRFFWANFTEAGVWRDVGLRTRLGQLVLAEGLKVDPDRRDSAPYHDQSSLEDALRISIEQALLHGPAVWDRFGKRLLESD